MTIARTLANLIASIVVFWLVAAGVLFLAVVGVLLGIGGIR